MEVEEFSPVAQSMFWRGNLHTYNIKRSLMSAIKSMLISRCVINHHRYWFYRGSFQINSPFSPPPSDGAAYLNGHVFRPFHFDRYADGQLFVAAASIFYMCLNIFCVKRTNDLPYEICSNFTVSSLTRQRRDKKELQDNFICNSGYWSSRNYRVSSSLFPARCDWWRNVAKVCGFHLANTLRHLNLFYAWNWIDVMSQGATRYGSLLSARKMN